MWDACCSWLKEHQFPRVNIIITSLLHHYCTISLTFPLSAGDSLMSGTLPGPTVSLVGVALGFEGEGAVCERRGRLLRRSNLRLRSTRQILR